MAGGIKSSGPSSESTVVNPVNIVPVSLSPTATMRYSLPIVLLFAGCALAQFDSPLPPRPIIPGAQPVGPPPPRRGSYRQQSRRIPQPIQDDLPLARPRGRPQQPSLPIRPSRLQSGFTPLPAPLPQFPSSAAPPQPIPSYLEQPIRPVVEEPAEDPLGELEQTLNTTPQSFVTPVYQTQKPQYRPQPSIDDFPVPSRQQYRNNFQEEQQQQQFIRPARPQPEVRPRPSQQQQQTQQQYTIRQQIKEERRPQPPKSEPHTKGGESRARKPTAQVLRKYREDNPDGSITWGFENDDGTYKEETIGTDCVTRGKYGYVDPDGVRREYTYTSGIPCDKEKEDAESEATDQGYIDYTSNRYVMPNGDYIDLTNMVKNRARKPVRNY